MEKVFELLQKNNVCAVSTSSADIPRVSIVEYYLAGNAIIFATSPDSIKAQNLKKNNRISMAVYNLPQFVTLDGSTVEPTQEEKEDYNRQLFIHHPEFVEMFKSGGAHPFAYFKLKVDTAYYNDYSEGMSPTQIIKP